MDIECRGVMHSCLSVSLLAGSPDRGRSSGPAVMFVSPGLTTGAEIDAIEGPR
jgi:hypothetical protein